jgi:polyphosphate kinase
MADVNRIFNFLESHKTGLKHLRMCKHLLVSPVYLRRTLYQLIDKEIQFAKAKRRASIILKLNSLSDETIIRKLYEAAIAGVEIKLIVRGIFCAFTENKKFKIDMHAVSIVDEYLEHGRVMVFHNDGKEKVYISSADVMVRNLDHRVEAAIPIFDPGIARELKDILDIQLKDNVKARWLDNDLSNEYVRTRGKKIRSQFEVYNFLLQKAHGGAVKPETPRLNY